MLYYADSSILVALFDAKDSLAGVVRTWRQAHQGEIQYVWNALLRQEVRHHLRIHKNTHPGRVAWNTFRGAEGHPAYFPWQRNNLETILAQAEIVDERLVGQHRAGTWDVAHIAAALLSGAEELLTGDAAQAEAAKLAGLDVRLFAP